MSYITISCIFGSSTMLTGGWYIEPKCPLLEFVRNIHIWPRWEAKAKIIIFEENHRVSYIPSSQKGVWFSCLHLKLRLTLLTFLCFFFVVVVVVVYIVISPETSYPIEHHVIQNCQENRVKNNWLYI